MQDQQMEDINYNRIAEAIEYLLVHFQEQPTLDILANETHLSAFHFQRLFSSWAGTTPKKFLQYISVEYAKRLLREKNATLFDAAHETGLSGTSRLHDLFISIEGMTPAEYKNGGRYLSINYSFAESIFGNIIVATTPKGVCYMAFQEDEEQALHKLTGKFPNANFTRRLDPLHQDALYFFQHDFSKQQQIRLHLQGTPFQLKVWETLLKIPSGELCTYGAVAHQLALPGAARAVGTAIGSNPIAYLIPCHRVIQSTGAIGGYRWGNTRKTALIGWEAARVNGVV